jgi:uncharacterized protein (DUF427 family)
LDQYEKEHTMTHGDEVYAYPSARNRIVPEEGQESVWDYPRPPSYRQVSSHIRVIFNGAVIAETRRAIRVLQTGIPPVYYIPRDDVRMEYLTGIDRQSYCPYKGTASYWSVQVGGRSASNAAWSYPDPFSSTVRIKDYLAFYAHAMDSCSVDGELAAAPDWKWIGGWVTSTIVGPFIAQSDIPQVEHLQNV